MFTISILPAARNDLEGIADWYNDQQYGLGLIFLDDVESAFQFLGSRPLAFRVRYDLVRVMRIGKRFPHFLHYAINESSNDILVIGVFHAKQNPSSWAKSRVTG
jgi:plasmid stabilization system protein ParE